MIYYEFIHYKHFLEKNKGIPVGISILINKYQMKFLIYPQFKDAHEMRSNTQKVVDYNDFIKCILQIGDKTKEEFPVGISVLVIVIV